jgi:signal transduction histidine kinase
LSDLVNDWLDLAKIEAGKVEVRIEQFEVDELFGALRALFRPIASESRVPLVFEPLPNLPPLVSDHGKIAQVMRNLISNALKFTDEGEVRVNAAIGPAETVTFTVCDTGIGIAPSDLERIFEEFAQVENPIQRRVKGTGLGLPLSRRLARLVGGEITVRSAIAVGSTFTLTVPVLYGGALTMAPTADDLEDQARRASAAGASHA